VTNHQLRPDTSHKTNLARSTPDIEVLRELSKDQCSLVRASAAKNPRVDEEMLTRLARDAEYSVREQVAWWYTGWYIIPGIPENIILELAEDPEPRVRLAVAATCTNIPAVSETLAKDKDYRILCELLFKDHSLTDDTLLRIRSYFNSVLMRPSQTLQDRDNFVSFYYDDEYRDYRLGFRGI
jgi:hypothetical protein